MHTPLSQILLRLAVISQLEVQESEYTKNLTVGPGQLVPGSRQQRRARHDAGSQAWCRRRSMPSWRLCPALPGCDHRAHVYAGAAGLIAEDEWQSGIKSWDKACQVRS